jgi:hypothetical protein
MSTQRIDSARNSQTLDRLKLYSLAAAAAGVSVLALGQPAESEVIVTKKNLPIPMSRNCCEGVEISLSNNGVNDFSISLLNYTTKYISVRHLNIKPLSKGAAVIESDNGYTRPNALALARGANIGRAGPFSGDPLAYIERTNIWTNGTKRSYGNWGGNTQNKYLGVRFFINGKVHFGWVRLTVNIPPPRDVMSATITAYAYETVPNRSILAGTPDKPTAGAQPEAQAEDAAQPSLGMLALGVDGLPMWRVAKEVSVLNEAERK